MRTETRRGWIKACLPVLLFIALLLTGVPGRRAGAALLSTSSHAPGLSAMAPEVTAPPPIPTVEPPVVTPAVTNTPACADDWEPNNTSDTARTIPPNGVIRDLLLCPEDDADYFALPTSGGQRYVVETIVENGLDTLLSVSLWGQPLAQNNDKSSADRGSRVEFDSEYGATYELLVSNVGPTGASEQHYVLAVSANPLPTGTAAPSGTPTQTPTVTTTPSPSATSIPCLDDFEDDGVTDTAKAILPGERQDHLFCPAGDADWLTFYANSGKGYKIETSQLAAGADTYMYLLAPDGSTVLAGNDDAQAAPGSSQLLFYPVAEGWYFVQVKNQGDIGFPGLSYEVALSLANTLAPSGGTPQPAATNTRATSLASVTPVVYTGPEGTGQAEAMDQGQIAADDLLAPQDGGAGSAGLPVFVAGPDDAMQPDGLEPNDIFEQAAPLNIGAVYQQLNFVPAAIGEADGDFYTFRAKPGLCYLIQTGDLAAGLDTTILLWQAAPTREGRKLLAENDDAQPKTENLSSSVRWCSGEDAFLVVELHNYGWAPLTDPRGKSYSLAVLIDPPTTTTISVPPVTDTSAPAGEYGGVDIVGGAGIGPGEFDGLPEEGLPDEGLLDELEPPVVVWTATPPASPTYTATAVVEPPTPTLVTTFTPTAGVTPSATLTPVATALADLTCYLDLNQNEAPDPGEGIQGVRGVVIDTLTNQVIGEALSDANGHMLLNWTARESVRIALPDLGWNQEVGANELQREKSEPVGAGRWSAEVRVKAPALPAILP